MVLGIVFWIVKGKKEVAPVEPTDSEAALMDVPLEKRPVVSFTPDAVGHYIRLHIEKIEIAGAKTMDYELVYQVPEKPSQGVPGSIEVDGRTSFDADLLLGSESSGKFRYDEGVETGMLTLRFRNEKGKLLAKFSSEFHMQKDASELTSTDGKFKYTLNKAPKGVFYVTMPSIGILANAPSGAVIGNYVVMAASSGVPGSSTAGSVTIEGSTVYKFDNGWKKLEGEKDTTSAGYYIGVK